MWPIYTICAEPNLEIPPDRSPQWAEIVSFMDKSVNAATPAKVNESQDGWTVPG
jgi:hypothetical protein